MGVLGKLSLLGRGGFLDYLSPPLTLMIYNTTQLCSPPFIRNQFLLPTWLLLPRDRRGRGGGGEDDDDGGRQEEQHRVGRRARRGKHAWKGDEV